MTSISSKFVVRLIIIDDSLIFSTDKRGFCVSVPVYYQGSGTATVGLETGAILTFSYPR